MPEPATGDVLAGQDRSRRIQAEDYENQAHPLFAFFWWWVFVGPPRCESAKPESQNREELDDPDCIAKVRQHHDEKHGRPQGIDLELVGLAPRQSGKGGTLMGRSIGPGSGRGRLGGIQTVRQCWRRACLREGLCWWTWGRGRVHTQTGVEAAEGLRRMLRATTTVSIRLERSSFESLRQLLGQLLLRAVARKPGVVEAVDLPQSALVRKLLDLGRRELRDDLVVDPALKPQVVLGDLISLGLEQAEESATGLASGDASGRVDVLGPLCRVARVAEALADDDSSEQESDRRRCDREVEPMRAAVAVYVRLGHFVSWRTAKPNATAEPAIDRAKMSRAARRDLNESRRS